jgi:predicted metalloprotease with PDZ domain
MDTKEAMTRQFCRRVLLSFVFAAACFWLAKPALAADQFRTDYSITVQSTEGQLFHVTADFKNIGQDSLDLSLPTWTPGWYTVENYYRNVLRLSVTDSKGVRLQPVMTRKQTWLVNTKGLNEIKVEFDYHATVLALNQAKITSDYAFFTGTELFLEPLGHRASPSTVTFRLPAGWQIISALKETGDPMVFTATDYDNLVDSPTEMGNFDTTRFEVEGKPHIFVATPKGSLTQENTDSFTKMLAMVAKAQSVIFGGLPYQKYIYFYFFARPESNAAGALEHNNSHVAFARSREPNGMIGTAAHEFFHLWNVKRLRPAEMWPYDYSRENETPLLWVSEGFTNYYASKSLYRAGLRDREQFLKSVEDAIGGVERNDARNYIPPASASVSTWVGYDTPVAFGISYYTQGQNLGALLDLSILHDSKAKYGLDDVMGQLYREYYEKGKGFTTENMVAIVNKLAGRDYHDFYRKYVWGVEVPEYAEILGYAGYSLDSGTHKVGLLGVSLDGSPEEVRVAGVSADGPAAKAGLHTGDVLVSIDGIDLKSRMQEAFDRVDKRIGESVTFSIVRAGNPTTVDILVGSTSEPNYEIVETKNPTAEQLAVREAWLRK